MCQSSTTLLLENHCRHALHTVVAIEHLACDYLQENKDLGPQEPAMEADQLHNDFSPFRSAPLLRSLAFAIKLFMFSAHRLASHNTGSYKRWALVSRRVFSSSGANRTDLPTHYTLPSGDKIPSVALGACVETMLYHVSH